jgi:predicted DCC family thiol-disulfide oxidoreductase YuxK
MSDKTTVFYDGACPLCEREISFYKRRKGSNGVTWIDVSSSVDDEIAPGLNREQALARFHVINAAGKPVSGGEAFACLWAALPGFRHLGRLFQARPLLWILNHAYDLFLHIRPLLQKIVRSPKLDICGQIPKRSLRDLWPGWTGEPKSEPVHRQQRG